MKRLIAALTLGLALAACSSGPTRYIPALDGDDMGYREQRIEEQRYRVSFRANPDLKAAEAEEMAMRRAAELTIQNSYQWFHVVSRMTDVAGGSRSSGGPTIGLGGSSGSYGWRWSWAWLRARRRLKPVRGDDRDPDGQGAETGRSECL